MAPPIKPIIPAPGNNVFGGNSGCKDRNYLASLSLFIGDNFTSFEAFWEEKDRKREKRKARKKQIDMTVKK